MLAPGVRVSLPDESEPPLLEAYLARRDDLVRFFTARLRSSAAAEDLVQDMYERVVRVDQTVENPTAYLYRLGANLLLDRARYDRRRIVRETAWSDARSDALGGARVVNEPSPEATAAARDEMRRLLAAVERLPPQARRAFRLHKLQGLTHAETAVAMGVSKSAVEKHISVALGLLTKMTARWGETSTAASPRRGGAKS